MKKSELKFTGVKYFDHESAIKILKLKGFLKVFATFFDLLCSSSGSSVQTSAVTMM
jgi:hypothetical protein